MQKFIKELTFILDNSQIILDASHKSSYETDWRNVYTAIAIAVILPKNVDEIISIIKLCNKFNVKITPQGGNTSTCGAATPATNNTHVIINLKNMNQIIALNADNNSIVVESGCTLNQLNNYLVDFGLFFPLKIASEQTCQIGGNIATNAGGINVIKYGMMRNLVLGLEVVTADAKVINQLKSLYKDNTNFDLKQLFIGSEGTLGIITKATLKVYPKPINFITIYLSVDNIGSALILKKELLRYGIFLAAFEIISKYTLEMYNNVFQDLLIFPTNNWYVLIEIEDYGVDITSLLHEVLSKNNYNDCIIATNKKERDLLWQIREKIPLAEKLSKPAIKFDISLPIDKIDIFLNQIENNLVVINQQIKIIVFGHLGDGNLHFNLQFDNVEIIEKIKDFVSELVYDTLINLGGSISAEHGIGLSKKFWYHKYEDYNSLEKKKLIKQIFDPDNLFNPSIIY